MNRVALYNKGCESLLIKFNELAKMLPSFLAALNSRATMCQWNTILTIDDDDGNPRHIIMHHGTLNQANVDVGIAKRQTNAAKPTPPALNHVTAACDLNLGRDSPNFYFMS